MDAVYDGARVGLVQRMWERWRGRSMNWHVQRAFWQRVPYWRTDHVAARPLEESLRSR